MYENFEDNLEGGKKSSKKANTKAEKTVEIGQDKEDSHQSDYNQSQSKKFETLTKEQQHFPCHWINKNNNIRCNCLTNTLAKWI